MQQKLEIKQICLPPAFLAYVERKTRQGIQGGRPHFLGRLGKEHDVIEEILNICELVWLRNKNLESIAENYKTSSKTLYRILKDLEPLKSQLSDYLQKGSRTKRWYIPELESSDFETVQKYIQRAKRDGLKRYGEQIKMAKKAWIYFKYRDPSYWNADEVCAFLNTLSQGSQSRMLDSLRQIAPQVRDEIRTGRFREKLGRRKKDLFRKEIKLVRQALKTKEFREIKILFDLHITTGAREGSRDPRSGLTGLTWEKFKDGFKKVDLYESKVRGGITWRDCPLDLFFKDLPKRLKSLWIQRGKPTNGKVFREGYKEVTRTYQELRTQLRIKYEGLLDPSLLKEFITLRPHDADKIHVNLLWEAEIPLEVVAGQYLGKGEGIGLMGRGWLDVNVIKKHYLSLTSRSKRIKKLQNQVREYSSTF
jgi:hypothetical protein